MCVHIRAPTPKTHGCVPQTHYLSFNCNGPKYLVEREKRVSTKEKVILKSKRNKERVGTTGHASMCAVDSSETHYGNLYTSLEGVLKQPYCREEQN